jgi:hypothetical protein
VAERLNGEETFALGVGLLTIIEVVVEEPTVIFRFTTEFTP